MNKDVGYSQSMLTVLMSCELKYHLKFIKQLKVSEQESAAMNFGSALHAALEAMLTGEGDYMQVFNMYWQTMKDCDVKYTHTNWESYQALGEVYLSRFERLHKDRYKLVHAEQRLKATFNETLFEGTPDYLGEYKGIPTLIDFKTSIKPYDKFKPYIHPQLNLYAFLANKVLDYKVEQYGYIVFVSRPEPRIQEVIVPVDEAVVLRHMSVLNKFALTADNPQPKANYMSCNTPYTCEYFEHCHGIQIK